MIPEHVRVLSRRAEQLGRKFTWWSRAPSWLLVPTWWRWTVWLGYCLAADAVADRTTMSDWPPRLT